MEQPSLDPRQQFGCAVDHYANGRIGYAAELFELLKQSCPTTGALLDLGCGTGIATKQLWDCGYRNLVGCDVDPAMLAVAKQVCPDVSWICAEASALPFESAAFEVVALFGSFHWFCHAAAIQEIRRVLKPGGLIVVVKKQEIGPFFDEYFAWLEQVSGQVLDFPKERYRPMQKLKEQRFEIVSQRKWHSHESLTMDQALSFCQSIYAWNSLAQAQKKLVAPKLSDFLAPWIIEGQFIRPIQTQMLVAQPF